MRTYVLAIAGALLMVAPLMAQETAESRVRERLPVALAERILSVMEGARERSLPDEAVADIALYGAARGADAQAIVTAAREQVRLLGVSRDALTTNVGAPSGPEVAAGAQALRAGIAPEELRALAQGARDGRSLSMAATLLAGFAAAGLPAGRAAERLAALGIPGPPGMGLPIGGFTLPFGPPPGLPVNIGAPGDRPGRPAGPPFNPPGGRP